MPYIGEIRMFAGNFPPAGWAFCNGAPMPISENDALFVVLGTIYGGDGQSTFNLPDLRGRLPVHQGTGPGLSPYTIGEAAGVESVTLTTNQIPVHSHALVATISSANDANPANNLLAQSGTFDPYQALGATTAMNASSIGPVGGSQPHTNFQPYLCINFIISLFGIFPSPT